LLDDNGERPPNLLHRFAKPHRDAALATSSDNSPFSKLLNIARSQSFGRTRLGRWWLPENARSVSPSFDWRSIRQEQMLQELLYYWLALGQPDPDRTQPRYRPRHPLPVSEADRSSGFSR
jgi:hypothetical protein